MKTLFRWLQMNLLICTVNLTTSLKKLIEVCRKNTSDKIVQEINNEYDDL